MADDVEQRVRKLEHTTATLRAQMSTVAEKVDGLREEQRKDFISLKGDLGDLQRELSSWSGGRRAIVWMFSAILAVVGLSVPVVVALML